MKPSLPVQSFRSVAVLWATFFLACPRPAGLTLPDNEVPEPTTPRYEARRDPQADEALAQAAQLAEVSTKEKGAEAYMAVRTSHPKTTAAQEALYRAGSLYFEAGDFAGARRSFNELLFENPLFDKAQDAKLKLGLAAMEVGAYRDAYQTLSSIVDKTPASERERILEAVGRAAEGALMFEDSLRVAMKLVNEATTPEERQQRLQRVLDLVEGRVGFLDIAKAVQGLPSSDPSWPILTFKLARIYYHLRDWANLEDSLNRFLREAPSHPYAVQAQELLERANRRTAVKPKVLGIVLPMTGKYKPIGEAVMRGVNLALKGSDVEVVVKDTQGDVNLAGKAVEELAFDEQAIAILGPVLGDDARRAGLVAEELQVPILTLTKSEGITELGPHVFRNMLTNSAQAQALAEYGTQVMGFKSYAMLYPNIPYGVELANEFWDSLLERGGTVRGAESYDHDQTTYTNEAKKLVGRYYLDDRAEYLEKQREVMHGPGDAFRKRKALEKIRSSLSPVVDFEALFIPDDWTRVSLVAPALAVEDIITNACDPKDLERIRKTTGKKDLKTITLLGTNQWNSPKGRSGLPELVERAGKFVLCSLYVDGFYAESSRPATKKFVRLYRDSHKENGRDPGLLEAIGYDSAAMIRQVLDQKAPQSRAQFREFLATVKDFNGATGKTTFSPERDAQKPLFFLTIDDKGIRELQPNVRLDAN